MKSVQAISVLVILVLAAVVVFLAMRERQPPLLPGDADHARFIAAEACLSCHGPQGSHPQGKNHPLGADCMRCHGRRD